MKIYHKLPVYIAIAASMIACSSKEEETAQVQQPVEEEIPMVDVKKVSMQEVPLIKEYTATIEVDNLNNISPSTPNRIKQILVDVGSQVKRGQTLVILDKANTDQLKVRLDLAQIEYDRAMNLLNIGSGTQQMVDQRKTELEALKSQYKNMMENTVLTSPISGVVTARNFDPGDMCGGTPILTVGQISPSVIAKINVTENDYSKIKNGMHVDVKFDAFENESFTGRIRRIHPTIDSNTRTFAVEVGITNNNQRIKPGMFARVEINYGSQMHVVVPDRAVVKQPGSGNKYVYVYSDGKVSYNKVELGQRIDDAYEIISGVNDGDLVVIAGQNQLANGVKVELIKRDANNAAATNNADTTKVEAKK
jgi:RND family efflux transporter MFP subunit